jgi:hypothetical protein
MNKEELQKLWIMLRDAVSEFPQIRDAKGTAIYAPHPCRTNLIEAMMYVETFMKN